MSDEKTNPYSYTSSAKSVDDCKERDREQLPVRLAEFGLCVQSLGWGGMMLCGYLPFMGMESGFGIAICLVAGFSASAGALVWKRSKPAKVGAVLGVVGLLYVPTILLPFFLRR